MAYRELQRRRNRQTGTTVRVEFESAEGWQCVCEDHGTVCSHETQALALRFAASPLDWCEECQQKGGAE